MNRKNGRHFDGFCPALALVLRLGLLYAAWLLCRIVFFLQNRAEIGPLAASELPGLLHGSLVFDTVSILYVNSLFIVLSLVPLRLRERRWYGTMLFWLFSVANALALIVNVSDGVYYHYAKKRFTSDELSYLGNNDNTGTVLLKALAENWYVALFAAGLIAALVWAYRRIRVAPSRIRSNTAYALIHLPALLVAVGLSIGGIRGGFSRQTRPITLSNATLYTASSPKANLILSNPFCMLRTLGNRSIAYTEFFDDRTLEAIYTPIHRPEAAAGDSLAFGDRNIVIFILESFSSEHSALLNPDLYPDGHGYTPFLDSLMREGYYFQNAFANGHKSIEALPSVLSSIPSYRTPFVLMPQALAPMKALPALLAEKGYKTSFFNGSGRGSMGFGAYAAQAGVQDYYSREDYEKRCGTDDFDGYWGIWDEEFRKRVERHQRDRGPEWTNIEEEKYLSCHDLTGRVVVIDCVTLWGTNFFFDNQSDVELSLSLLKAEFDKLSRQDAYLIFVTNELGMGGVPIDEVQRKFTDMQGWLNQYIASKADEVVLMVSGIPVKIKE